ncbi:MAG: serine/threonine-protein kinase [Polyangiaceae bacterium]
MPNTLPPAGLVGQKLGNYRLERLLGRGRMGMVYLARDEALLRPIALKLLAWNLPEAQHHDPEAWLLAEARNIARVSHPSVIQVYGVARHGPHAYIAMEYVDGVSAEQVVEERGPLSPSLATEILVQIAGALQAAHECGVIHRDVKPANILIRSDNSAKLGDFGMAIHRKTPADASTELQVGTPLYTAPELWNGEVATPATDLYALGATYHFLLTGHPPFETPDLAALIESHRRLDPPRLQGLSARLPKGCVEIARRCLAKTPGERVSSAQELSWLARGVLREAQSFRPDARPSVARLMRGAASESQPLHDALGLAKAPFGDHEKAPPIAELEPFRSVALELEQLFAEPGSVVLLNGAQGSGGLRLLRELAKPPRQRGPVALLAAERAVKEGSLAQRACRAFGALPSTQVATESALEGLLEHLAQSAGDAKGPALLVVEAAPWLRALGPELEPLALAARATKYFSLVVIASLDDDDSPFGAASVQLPNLSHLEVFEYLRACLQDARKSTSAPLLVTPDAALLVHRCTRGNLMQVNAISSRMLEVAAPHKSRVLTSWHAWVATQSEEIGATEPRPWPTPQVLQILNAERAVAGMNPRVEAARDAAVAGSKK